MSPGAQRYRCVNVASNLEASYRDYPTSRELIRRTLTPRTLRRKERHSQFPYEFAHERDRLPLQTAFVGSFKRFQNSETACSTVGGT
jgi:hypothetical protein